jgi:hypothetical protein
LNSIGAAVFGLALCAWWQAPQHVNLIVGNARISAESVKKVNEITTRLGNDIIKKE